MASLKQVVVVHYPWWFNLLLVSIITFEFLLRLVLVCTRLSYVEEISQVLHLECFLPKGSFTARYFHKQSENSNENLLISEIFCQACKNGGGEPNTTCISLSLNVSVDIGK